MLPKTAVAIGLFCLVPGHFWHGCPEADKKKQYKCTVLEFIGVHTFEGGRKGSAFKMKEMGESGEGSLEPGVASGDVFWIMSPNPFLKYYYKAHPDKLPEGHRDKPVQAPSPAPAPEKSE